jgi:hypothetical protein
MKTKHSAADHHVPRRAKTRVKPIEVRYTTVQMRRSSVHMFRICFDGPNSMHVLTIDNMEPANQQGTQHMLQCSYAKHRHNTCPDIVHESQY